MYNGSAHLQCLLVLNKVNCVGLACYTIGVKVKWNLPSDLDICVCAQVLYNYTHTTYESSKILYNPCIQCNIVHSLVTGYKLMVSHCCILYNGAVTHCCGEPDDVWNWFYASKHYKTSCILFVSFSNQTTVFLLW